METILIFKKNKNYTFLIAREKLNSPWYEDIALMHNKVSVLYLYF